MPKPKSIARYFPGKQWLFGQEKKRNLVAALRSAYGDNCWRCGHPMTFGSLPSRRKATIEHLLAKSHGGTSAWDNIRLCHPGCNRHLGIHPPGHKRRMRLALARERVAEFVEQQADCALRRGSGRASSSG